MSEIVHRHFLPQKFTILEKNIKLLKIINNDTSQSTKNLEL